MRLRSLLFIPADSEKKLQKGDDINADALILDLEDAVAESNKPAARQQASDYLKERADQRPNQIWVRINPITTSHFKTDLEAVLAGRPDGIIQPKTRSPEEVKRLSEYLDELEVQYGLQAGSIPIIPVATETPQAMFSMQQFDGSHQRLAAITWGAEDLSAALGAVSNKDENGAWTFPYQLARSFCLFAAASAEVASIDTIYAAFRDSAGLAESCRQARRDGFSGKLAIHPSQVDVINEAFTPSSEEINHAQAVVDAFAAQPGTGTLAFDGQMLDIPHLIQARKILMMAGQK
jgi:citrate lyase subunit beta/citryl-CoA lyase